MFNEFILVTAQYSNAVIAAILPHVTDMCQKLDLPVKTPVTIQQVAESSILNQKDLGVGAWITLTNGFEFWFTGGNVDSFYIPMKYYKHLWADSTNYYGQTNMTQEEAIEWARGTIRKLGYDITDLYADGVPFVEQSPGDGTNWPPRLEIRWPAPYNTNASGAKFEIDVQRKKIKSMALRSRFIWREDPKISVQPKELEPGELPDFAKDNPAAEMAFNMLPPSKKWTPDQQKKAAVALLPKVSTYAKRLGMDIPLPLTMRQVASYDATQNGIGITIALTNGCYFFIQGGEKGYVTDYEVPYSFSGAGLWKRKMDGHVRDYWGQWNMSEEEAIVLAHETFKKIFPEKNLYLEDKPEIFKPNKIGTNQIPRYLFHWTHWVKGEEPGTYDSQCEMEIDADKKSVKRIRVYNDTDMPKPPLQTNSLSPIIRKTTNAP